MKPCIEPEKFAQMKEAVGSSLVHQLLGCQWGRALHDREDTDPCEEPAAQIVALHPEGTNQEVQVKLCVRHVEKVTTLTTPHEGSTDAQR